MVETKAPGILAGLFEISIPQRTGFRRDGETERMKIAFEALIKKVSHKSLVSGDKSTEVTLQFDSSNKTKILNSLNKLQVADDFVMVVIMEGKDAQ